MNIDHNRGHELRTEMDVRRQRASRRAQVWRTRRRRRVLVVLAVLVAIASVVAAVAGNGLALVPYAGVFAGLLLTAGLRVLTRAVAESSDSQLDERDRALRDAAVRLGFKLLVAALVALYLYGMSAQGTAGFPDHMIGLLTAMIWAGPGGPTLILAWRLPDDDPEDMAAA